MKKGKRKWPKRVKTRVSRDIDIPAANGFSEGDSVVILLAAELRANDAVVRAARRYVDDWKTGIHEEAFLDLEKALGRLGK